MSESGEVHRLLAAGLLCCSLLLLCSCTLALLLLCSLFNFSAEQQPGLLHTLLKFVVVFVLV